MLKGNRELILELWKGNHQWDDEGDGETVLVNETFGELNEWNEVTHPWTR